jgi:hypothetical protein
VTDEPGKRSAAASAAEQVRAIIEAAERETAEQLGRVERTADRLAARADEIERELERLAEGVRDALRALRTELLELKAMPGSGAAPVTASSADEPLVPGEGLADELAEEPSAEEPPEPEASPAVAAGAGAPTAAGDGARVIALNMALNGSSREETARYLSENFDLDDPEPLLDDVYSRVDA